MARRPPLERVAACVAEGMSPEEGGEWKRGQLQCVAACRLQAGRARGVWWLCFLLPARGGRRGLQVCLGSRLGCSQQGEGG